MAAASSMTRSSAWPSLTASPGWMYCQGQTTRGEVGTHPSRPLPSDGLHWDQTRPDGVSEGRVCGRRGRRRWVTHLDGLPVLLEDVHPHHRLVEVRVQGLDDLVVEVLLRVTATGYTKMTCFKL